MASTIAKHISCCNYYASFSFVALIFIATADIASIKAVANDVESTAVGSCSWCSIAYSSAFDLSYRIGWAAVIEPYSSIIAMVVAYIHLAKPTYLELHSYTTDSDNCRIIQELLLA